MGGPSGVPLWSDRCWPGCANPPLISPFPVMTGASSSTRRTASLTLALCVCALWPHAISQAKEVCGERSSFYFVRKSSGRVAALSDLYSIQGLRRFACLVTRKLEPCLSFDLLIPIGSGPHTLSQTALDVYLLPNSYVTLHSVPLQQGDIVTVIRWFAVQKTRARLLSQKLKQNKNNFVIGPMDQNLTLLGVKYAYYKQKQIQVLATSNTAVLHLAS